MTNQPEVINPAILELVALGNGRPGTKISAPTREEIRRNLDEAFEKARHRREVINGPSDSDFS